MLSSPRALAQKPRGRLCHGALQRSPGCQRLPGPEPAKQRAHADPDVSVWFDRAQPRTCPPEGRAADILPLHSCPHMPVSPVC